MEEGLSNPAIAARLQLSRRTVATHVSHILKKLDVHSRTDIAREAARTPLTAQAREAARALEAAAVREAALRADVRQLKARRVAPRAADLLAAAVRLLPTADRARYAEEYRSELWDLAQSGAGRLRQLWYALRQLRRVLPMSAELRSPRRRGASL